MLLAGTATGHDAVADYERVVARRAARGDPARDIEIPREPAARSKLVAQLRGARAS